jgi:transposase
LALSGEDCQLLLDALVTLASMQDRLASHDVTVHKLRKLLGIEKSSEKQTDVIKKTKNRRKVAAQNGITMRALRRSKLRWPFIP